MGIKVVGSFTTPEGFAYTDIYLRLTTLTVHANKPRSNVHLGFTVYLSKEAYDDGKSSLTNPPVSTAISTTVPFVEIGTLAWVPFGYYHFSEWLKWKGFVVEDVLEEGQSAYTPPTALVFVPPPEPTVISLILPTEPAPIEPVAEPAPTESAPDA
jgi:hypothetical protein